MTDFDYDCMQKKRIANSARRQKKGSKSKKCTLPSDRLTHKQWKERCGAVMSYNFGSPMKWEDFKQMPERIQAEYITNLQEKYSATATDLAKMFGVKPLTVTRHVGSKNLDVTFHRGKSMTVSQKEEWSKFVNEEQCLENVVDDSDSCAVEVQEDLHPVVFCNPDDETENNAEPVSQMNMRTFSLTFDGSINIDAIANSLRLILGSNAIGSIEIACRLE